MQLGFGASRGSIGASIFLIGMAILFTFGWMWPGILVLFGLTFLVDRYLRRLEPDDDEIPLRVDRPLESIEEQLEAPVVHQKCPSCGGMISGSSSAEPGVCAYCGSRMQLIHTQNDNGVPSS